MSLQYRIKVTDASIFTPFYGNAIGYLAVVCDSQGTRDCFLEKHFYDGFASLPTLRLPTFYQLVVAQGYDGDSTSLSLDDLKHVQKDMDHSEASRRKAESAFMGEYGSPLAVIVLPPEKNDLLPSGSYRLVRLADGTYWVGSEEGGKTRFTPVDQTNGKKLEEAVALKRLQGLSGSFNGSSAMKNTANGPNGGEMVIRFGDAFL